MARKTFISYKFSEAQELRDKIIESLGEDSKYYRGETSDSPDLTDTTTDNIKRNLKDMIWGTSVTIVIISPNMNKSNWINWEIEYSLKKIQRGGITSQSNGVVGVIMKYNGNYNWIRTESKNEDGHISISIDNDKLYPIIVKNRFNQNPIEYSCQKCKTVDSLKGSYISLIDEETFLKNPNHYIEDAYSKSKNIDNYIITKQV